MTQATLDKAERIQITTVNPHALKAQSGSHANLFYIVCHDGHTATQCSCPARTTCCHMIAANRSLAQAATRRSTFQALRSRYDSRLNGEAVTRRCYYELSLGL